MQFLRLPWRYQQRTTTSKVSSAFEKVSCGWDSNRVLNQFRSKPILFDRIFWMQTNRFLILDKNKYNKNKYAAGGFPGSYGGGYGAAPWYSSTSFANSFAPGPMYSGHNFNNLGGGNNLYPRQSTPNYYPPSIYSTSNNRGFGHLNTPDLSPNFYNRPGSAPYPSNNPSYPAYPPPKYTPAGKFSLSSS